MLGVFVYKGVNVLEVGDDGSLSGCTNLDEVVLPPANSEGGN